MSPANPPKRCLTTSDQCTGPKMNWPLIRRENGQTAGRSRKKENPVPVPSPQPRSLRPHISNCQMSLAGGAPNPRPAHAISKRVHIAAQYATVASACACAAALTRNERAGKEQAASIRPPVRSRTPATTIRPSIGQRQRTAGVPPLLRRGRRSCQVGPRTFTSLSSSSIKPGLRPPAGGRSEPNRRLLCSLTSFLVVRRAKPGSDHRGFIWCGSSAV
jgi:hypothetical protein